MPETTERKPREMPFKMGADPEFLIFHGTKILDASKIIKYFIGQTQNQTLEANAMGYEIGKNGQLGWDGTNQTGEIRPTPEKNIDKLTEHIGQLLQTMNQKVPFADLTTLSIGTPAGGHIHVDITNKNQEFRNSLSNNNRASKAIATFLIPIIAADHRISAASRVKGSGYGQADDIRIGEHGDSITLEIRGQSSEWLTTPKLTRSTLAYVGVVWNEIVNNPKLFKNEIVFKNKPQITAIQDMVISNYKPLFDSIISQIAKVVKTFELYKEFKEEIDFILDTEAVYAEKEKNGWNIGQGWNFQKNKAPTKRDLFSGKKTKNRIKNIDMELINTSLSIDYNDDRHVSNFANAISERIAAFGWNLKNNYFLFGLAKGENNFLAATGNDVILCKNEQDGEMPVYVTPTTRTANQARNTLLNMWSKIKYNSSNSLKINPKTGKLLQDNKNTVMIGIPYETREENKIKDLINLIWKIESGKLVKKKIKDFILPQTATQTNIGDDAKAAILQSSKEQNLNRAAVEIINRERREPEEENNPANAAISRYDNYRHHSNCDTITCRGECMENNPL